MGIMILNPTINTVPKAGRLATGSYTHGVSPVFDKHGGGNVFNPEAVGPSFGNVGPPSVSVGNIAQRDLTKTHYPNPLSTFINVATIRDVDAITTFENVHFYNPIGFVPEISPHERTVLSTIKKVSKPQKTQFGATSNVPADTPFHPQSRVVKLTPQPRTSFDQSAYPSPQSWPTRNNIWFDPNNSFYRSGRWGVVKRGAAG